MNTKTTKWDEYIAKCKALHLRPIRLQGSDTVYIAAFFEDNSIVAIYRVEKEIPHPGSPVGWFSIRTIDRAIPFTDEELAEETVFQRISPVYKMREYVRHWTDLNKMSRMTSQSSEVCYMKGEDDASNKSS